MEPDAPQSAPREDGVVALDELLDLIAAAAAAPLPQPEREPLLH